MPVETAIPEIRHGFPSRLITRGGGAYTAALVFLENNVPIENERKYVLRDHESAYHDLINGVSYWGLGKKLIQGYLPGDARIRMQYMEQNPGTAGVFTYKIMTPEGLVEIETMIDKADFDRLWPLTRDRLRKNRFTIFREGLRWDVDFFQDEQNQIYFALAECEMPEGMIEPSEILPPLRPYIAYVVPLERQTEFTNVRLANPEYARNLKW
jgi:CYTH domain-containing protein